MKELSIDEWKSLTAMAAHMQGVTLIWSSEPDLKPRSKDTMQTYAPIDDDGDAFRLANHLILRIEHVRPMRGRYDRVMVSAAGRGNLSEEVLYGSDRDAAVRLAIVRVAAQMFADQP